MTHFPSILFSSSFGFVQMLFLFSIAYNKNGFLIVCTIDKKKLVRIVYHNFSFINWKLIVFIIFPFFSHEIRQTVTILHFSCKGRCFFFTFSSRMLMVSHKTSEQIELFKGKSITHSLLLFKDEMTVKLYGSLWFVRAQERLRRVFHSFGRIFPR